MIAIVSSVSRERTAFAALCQQRGWTCAECESLHALKKLLRHLRPHVVLTRHKLGDGYSDDIIAALSSASRAPVPKVIVLLPAGFPSDHEARQISLGADYVQRDPVRSDVLAEYLAKYLSSSKRRPHRLHSHHAKPFPFAGARLHPVERRFTHGTKTARLTPREVELGQLLASSGGHVVTYETLYGEILGRTFRGDTSNLRVLLGKLDASLNRVGVSLRRWVEVIPKLGYRYRRPPSTTTVAKPRRAPAVAT